MRVLSEKIQFGKYDIIKLYELMYKWGMIQAHKRQEGWLSDEVERLLHNMEQELLYYLDLGISALAQEFDAWLEWHSQYLSYPVEDDEDLQSEMAKEFLNTENIVSVERDDEALEYIDENNLFEEYINWLKTNYQEENEYDAAYKRVADAQDLMYLAKGFTDIPDKIEAFNTGLMVEHTGGVMKDNLQDFPEITTKLLNDLSSGTYTDQWNKDLRQFGIRAMKKRVCADAWGWEEEEQIPEEQDLDLSYFTNNETQLVSEFVDEYYVKPITNMVKSLSRKNNTESDIVNSVADYLKKEISSSFFRGKELRNDLLTQALNYVDWTSIVNPYIQLFSGPQFMGEEDELENLENLLKEFSPETEQETQQEAAPEVAPKQTKKPSNPTNWTSFENSPDWTWTV